MTSTVYTFIATKSTYTTTIPLYIQNVAELSRRVRNAFAATDYPIRVGELRDFPLAVAVENFLLCDGSEAFKDDFPELSAYLTQDAAYQATDPLKFKLPNYVGAKTQAPTAPPQVVDPGSVGIGTPPPSPPTSPGDVGGSEGQPPSGGRPRDGGRPPL